MPKGGDIHNHLTGAVYAEDLIDRASSEGKYVFLNNYSLSDSSIANETVPVSQAYRDAKLYDRLIDDWSMRESEFLNVSGISRGEKTRRYICRHCGKAFCDHTGTYYHDLRKDEKTIDLALKMSMKGMSIEAIAEVL